MSRVTISDVAAAAEVSIKTVSRVINREPNVRPAVRAQVEAAIERLGFVPNTAARSLASSRSFILGAIFDNPNPSYIVALQRGAMAACRASGYHLAIEELNLLGDVAAQMQAILATSRMDGVILSPPVTDNGVVLDALEAKGLQYVRLMPAAFPGRSPAVIMDDWTASAEVASYLWRLGHRRLAIVCGPSTHGASRLRLEGFLHGVTAAGGKADDVRVLSGDFSFQSGRTAGHAILNDTARPTAVFASNDEMAAGIYSAAAERHVHIPGDLSVVGYDDSPMAERVWPMLTTVRQPVADMAHAAARLLIDGGEEAPIIELPYKLITRQSAAAKA